MILKTALEKIFLPLGDFVTRQQVMHYYNFFLIAQWWPVEKLNKYQNNQIKFTVRKAYEDTLFYKHLFDKCRIKPTDINTVDDLSKLPIVTKGMLREAYPHKCTRKTVYPCKEYFTSGSSGQPFAVKVDNHSISIARALMLLRLNFSGWKFGDVSLQTGMTLNRGCIKKIKDILLRTYYVSAFNLSDEAIDNFLYLVEKKKVEYISGYASSLFCIAERARKLGFNYTLKGAISWGDNMFNPYRNCIESQFKCRVTDTYGCGEGIQVSAQCSEGNGHYHIFTPHVAVEFVKNGMPVQNGDLGEILLTRLDPGAMPLIRYKIGDVGKASKTNQCPCGRGFMLMESIEGRDSDIIITPSGKRLIVHFFTGIFEYSTSIDTFQVVQEKKDEILVKIVPKKHFKLTDWENIKREIKEKGDPDLKIRMQIVKQIKLEKSNKRRFVISNLT